MKYFIDTEFIEDGRTIDLISLAIVAEDDRELYCQNLECDFSKASEWVRRNVLMALPEFDIVDWKPDPEDRSFSPKGLVWRTRIEIANAIKNFVFAADGKPVFWGYYADYDWVAVCQLFG